MKKTCKVISALFQKDCKDTLQNMNVLILVVLPLLFAVLYTNIFSDMLAEMPPNFILNMVVGMTLSLIPTSFLSTIVAEEKEKNTLRTLMLSGVTATEFIFSKTLLTLLILEAVSIACFFISGGVLSLLPLFLLLVTLASIGLLFIGATIGLLCKDQMSTGVLSAPAAMILLLPTMLSGINDSLTFIAKLTPIHWVLTLLNTAQQGESLLTMTSAKGLCVMLAWIIFPAIAFGMVYRWKRLD